VTHPRTDRVAELEREIADLRRRLERSTATRPTSVRRALGAVRRRVRPIFRRMTRYLTRSSDHVGAIAVDGPPSEAVPRFFTDREPTASAERVTNPDVTVVIPVFNSADWLEDCLSSVLAQTGVSLEVICVDDGSTDDSAAVLERYAHRDPRVAVLHQQNSGQSVARNRGLEAAAGRYVIFLDSDDFWPSDSLATLVADADDNELDVLMFDCFSFRDGAVPEAAWARYAGYYQRRREYGEIRSGADMIVDMRRGRDYRPHVGMYVSRTALIREAGVRFVPGIVHQDNPFTFSLLLRATRTAHRRIDAYARRIRPGSTITALADADSVTGYLVSYLAMSDELRRAELPPELTATLAEIVYGTFEGAHKKFGQLSAEVRNELTRTQTSADAQVAFRILSGTLSSSSRR